MRKLLFVLGMMVAFVSKGQWSEVGGLNGLAANGGINAICKDNYGNIYAAGWFTNANGNNYVAVYDGSSWSELGGVNALANIVPANQLIGRLYSDTLGNVYATNYYVNCSGISYVVKYNGTSWSILGGISTLFSSGEIKALFCDKTGNVYVGGDFTNLNGKKYVAKWNGNNWSELGGNNGLAANGRINTICGDNTGNIYTSGWFTNDSSKYYVAKYNGSSWSELGGLNALSSYYQIFSICSDINGNIYAGAVNSNWKWYVAKYNGSNWSQLGATNNYWNAYNMWTVCSDNFGNNYGGNATNSSGKHFVAKYNGSSWSELGGNNSLAANGQIFITCSDVSTGNIYAGGYFKNASGNYYVAKYTQYLPLKLLSFTAKQQTPNSVALNWQTANEVNVSHINIQCSVNGKDFIGIGKVNAVCCEYHYNDNKLPITNDKLTLYYRLEIVDKDGSKMYSEIKQVAIGNKQLAINIYPNPAKDIVKIECAGAKQLLIIDYLGRIVYQSTVSGQLSTVNCKQLIKGVYVVKVILNNGEIKNEKLVVE